MGRGDELEVKIDLHFTDWVFPKDERIRIAIRNEQGEMLWQRPMQMTSTLTIGGKNGARIELPVVPPGEEYTPNLKEPSTSPILSGYETIDSGGAGGMGCTIYFLNRSYFTSSNNS